ncbi:type VII secretion integral membrane protein EccD [Mycolicibacterium litorale]|nr:type VII secretion integral membrane protein EccD [Mycolicibacterium litorale]
MAVADELRRVSIRAGDRDVDITLPAHLPLRDLLPAVVDLIGDRSVDGRWPCLRRVWGDVLDPVMSLAHSDVYDGESLILAAAESEVAPVHADSCAEVAAAVQDAARPWGRSPTRLAGWGVLWWAASASAVLLARAAFDRHTLGPVVAAATASALALSGATLARRHDPASVAAVGLGLLATGFAGVTGLLAAPGHPGLPGVFLATSASATTAVLAWRLLGCAAWVFLPLAAAGMAASVVSVGAVAGWWAFTAAGPALVLCALAVLVVSPRLVARGGPPTADRTDGGCADWAVRAHRRLTVLVLAAATAAGVGVVFTAAGTSRPVPAAGLIALTGMLTLLRAGANRDAYRVVALSVSTGVSASTVVVMAAVAAAPAAPWLCAVLMTVAAWAMRTATRQRARWSPAALRIAAALDLAGIVALVPLAGLTAGVLL